MLSRNSFAQTVENLFVLSFLVKDGRVRIDVDESGSQVVGIALAHVLIKMFLIFLALPCIYISIGFSIAVPCNGPSAEEIKSGVAKNHQFMFRFDFDDWKV